MALYIKQPKEFAGNNDLYIIRPSGLFESLLLAWRAYRYPDCYLTIVQLTDDMAKEIGLTATAQVAAPKQCNSNCDQGRNCTCDDNKPTTKHYLEVIFAAITVAYVMTTIIHALTDIK